MDTDLKHYVLTGGLERAPHHAPCRPRHADDGLYPHTHRAGLTGQECRLCVPVESYSQGAEQAGDLSAGDSVVVAGQVQFPSWTMRDSMRKTSLAVLARLMKVLTPASVTTDNHNEETPPLSRNGAWKPHHRDGWR